MIYQRSGDLDMLARQLPSMRGWVDKVAALAGADRLWTGGFQFGDWLDPTAPEDDPYRAKADADVVATAHLARSAQTRRRRGAGARRARPAAAYATLAAEVRAAFAARLRHRTAAASSPTRQTVYALAIEWDLARPRPADARR